MDGLIDSIKRVRVGQDVGQPGDTQQLRDCHLAPCMHKCMHPLKQERQ